MTNSLHEKQNEWAPCPCYILIPVLIYLHHSHTVISSIDESNRYTCHSEVLKSSYLPQVAYINEVVCLTDLEQDLLSYMLSLLKKYNLSLPMN